MPGATESASNTSAGSYVWRFSHRRWWSGSWQAVNRLSLPRKHYGPAVSMFRWTGRRKSGPSDFRSRPEPAPINSGPATTFFCSTSNARSVDKLSPPPKVRTERILQNSRLSPDETSSPVDQECRIPAKWAFFAQVMRQSRKLKTRWRSAKRAFFPQLMRESRKPEAMDSAH
jgi:hypothetical protein